MKYVHAILNKKNRIACNFSFEIIKKTFDNVDFLFFLFSFCNVNINIFKERYISLI